MAGQQSGTIKDLKIPNERVEDYAEEQRDKLQKAFGYTYEEYRTSILNMALNGAESIGAMGVDTPLAVFSEKHQPLFNYFKQLFAQVTNPPIDAIREEIVTSTTVYVGKDGNLFWSRPENCQVLKINNPILTNTDMLKIKEMHHEGFKVAVVSTTFITRAQSLSVLLTVCLWKLTKHTGTVPIFWCFPTEAWMKTICRFRLCWLFLQYISTL